MTPEARFKDAGINGKEFRGAPFWSWNDDLEPEELRRQIRSMCDSGMGGFFMHARVGLITPYLSEDYIKCHEACIDEARKLGMGAWLYDEDCWPSGNAGDISPARGPEYRAKSIKCAVVKGGSEINDNIVAVFRAQKTGDKVTGVARSSVDELVNSPADQEFVILWMAVGDYVDNLWPEAVASFIDTTHELFKRYFKLDFGGVVPGIFTDEPSFWAIPWTRRFPDEFIKRRGYDLIEELPSLFHEVGDFNRIRYDYYRTAMELYLEAFTKQIGEWCEKEGLVLTGHHLMEDSLPLQTVAIGAAMPQYEYMQIPGIDVVLPWLRDPLVVKQATSVAHQLGKPRVLSETFGCSGWNMSFEEQKWIGEWQYALGVNLMCQHLALYSLRGCRKRDYPPSIFYQQPWWPDYNMVEDHFARLAAALTSGKHVADALVIHPVESTWAYHDGTWFGKDLLNDEFVKVSDALLETHIGFDYGDESLMEKYARVNGDKLVVGKAEYKLIVLPPMRTIRKNTLKLITEFIANGGKVIVVGNLPRMIEGVKSDEPARTLGSIPATANDFIAIRSAVLGNIEPGVIVTDQSGRDIRKIIVNNRDLGKKRLFFLANSDRHSGYDARVAIPGSGLVEEWDLDSGDIRPLPCRVDNGFTTVDLPFSNAGSHLISFDPAGEPLIGKPEKRRVLDEIKLEGLWKITRTAPNALTLDYCRYKISNGDWSEPTHTIWLGERLADVYEETPLTLRFVFTANFQEQKPRDITLVMEIPEKFEISINGQMIEYTDSGWWTDISFKKIPIESLVKPGENVIELRCDNYLGAAARNERIKEIDLPKYLDRAYTNPPADVTDPIILPFKGEVADLQRKVNELKHGIELESVYIIGDFDVVRDGSGFVLTDVAGKVMVSNFVEQGYPFFSGSVVCTKVVESSKTPGERVVMSFDDVGAIVTKVRVNGKEAGCLAWHPLELDVTDCIVDGSNVIEIELINSCRNLLGPHHTVEGQRLGTGANSFKGMTCFNAMSVEDDRYSWGELAGKLSVDWTDEYVLVPLGLTSAPKLRRETLRNIHSTAQ